MLVDSARCREKKEKSLKKRGRGGKKDKKVMTVKSTDTELCLALLRLQIINIPL